VGLSASALGPTTVQLTWTPLDGASGYHVWRARSPTEGWTLVTPVPLATTTCTDATLAPNVEVYYRVTAHHPAFHFPGTSRIVTLRTPDVHPRVLPPARSFRAPWN
jgi:hypothetical protein